MGGGSNPTPPPRAATKLYGSMVALLGTGSWGLHSRENIINGERKRNVGGGGGVGDETWEKRGEPRW
jgi:hypothetical protein